MHAVSADSLQLLNVRTARSGAQRADGHKDKPHDGSNVIPFADLLKVPRQRRVIALIGHRVATVC